MPKLIHARRLVLAALALATPWWAALPAAAQSGQPVRLLVGYTAGGSADQSARPLAQALGKELGVPVVVENKPGANATIAGNEAARAKPDGLTLWYAASATITISPNVMSKMPFDPATDLTPIAPLQSYHMVLMVNNNEPYRNIRELVDYAKAHPGKLSYGSFGIGSSTHLSMLLLARRSGIELTHVPYKGSSATLIDLMGGQINMTMDIIGNAMPYIQSGKLRAIAVTSPQRNASLPNVPTIAESGIEGVQDFDVGGWSGIYAPKGMAPTLVERLNKAVNAALAQPELANRIKNLGFDEWSGTPEKLAERAARERAMWATVTQGIVLD